MTSFLKSLPLIHLTPHINSRFDALESFKIGLTSSDFVAKEIKMEPYLFFSRAIATYLCNKYAPDSELYPKDPEARARVDSVLYADTSFVQQMYGYVVSHW